MRIFALFGILSMLIAACSSGPSGQDKENIAVVEKYIQAVQANDTVAMRDLLSDDYIGYGPSYADTTNKEQALETWKYVTENLYEKIEYKRTVYVTSKITDGPHPGDYVADWAVLKITYKNSSTPVNLTMNAVYRIENGKITVSRTFYNEADVLRQLGYEFYPAGY